MYFTFGWPKILRVPESDPASHVAQIVANRDKIFFAVLTHSSLSVWTSKVSLERQETSAYFVFVYFKEGTLTFNLSLIAMSANSLSSKEPVFRTETWPKYVPCLETGLKLDCCNGEKNQLHKNSCVMKWCRLGQKY